MGNSRLFDDLAWEDLSAWAGKRVVAVKALANKLAKASFFILHDGTHFDARHLVGGV